MSRIRAAIYPSPDHETPSVAVNLADGKVWSATLSYRACTSGGRQPWTTFGERPTFDSERKPRPDF